ncbi:MAG TPA: hypothetical protein PLJ47_09305 [Candidatus Hydrogenedentes bacterium]|nr:hypothetical protein [Candidatus Hydrogenedentota bacterium]HRK34779.1 hypothetical protein [Candidatus Hydrogenedentota bacterium]
MLVGIFGGIVSLLILAIYIASVIWSYTDAERRGKSGILVALLVLLLVWPAGLIVWLLIRPNGRRS